MNVYGQAWREAGGEVGVIGGWGPSVQGRPIITAFWNILLGMGRRGAAGPEMRRGRILPPSRLLSFDCLPIRAAIGQTVSRPRAALGLFLLLEPDPGVASRSMTARLPIRSAHESEMQTWGVFSYRAVFTQIQGRKFEIYMGIGFIRK